MGGRGGAQERIGPALCGCAVHLVLAGIGHGVPSEVGLTAGAHIGRLYSGFRAVADARYDGTVITLGAIGGQCFHLVVIGVAGAGLIIGVVGGRSGAQERIGPALCGCAVHLVLAGIGHGIPLDVGLAAGTHIGRLYNRRHNTLFAGAMSVRLLESVIAFVNGNGVPLSLGAAVIYVSQARAARESHIPDVGHALRDLDAGQARAAVECIMPDSSRAAADGHAGQARTILENVVGNALHTVAERHLQPIAGVERILRAFRRPGVIVNLHQSLAAQKCIVPNAGHITADGHTGQAFAVGENVAGDLLHAFAEYHLHPAHGGSGTAECTAQASQIRCRPGVVADLLQVIAPKKCAVAQSGHALRDLYDG